MCDLFVIVLVSLLFWFLFKYMLYLGMVFFGVVWIIGSDLLIFFCIDVVFFFYLGGFLCICCVLLYIGCMMSWWLLVVYLVVVMLCIVVLLFIDFSVYCFELFIVVICLMWLLGVFVCWGCF